MEYGVTFVVGILLYNDVIVYGRWYVIFLFKT